VDSAATDFLRGRREKDAHANAGRVRQRRRLWCPARISC